MYQFILVFLMSHFLSAVCLSQTKIDITTENHEHYRHEYQFFEIVALTDEIIGEFLNNKLGCWITRLELNIIKEHGFWKWGAYNMNFKAQCNQTFKNFKMTFDVSEEEGIPFKFYFTYKRNGIDEKISIDIAKELEKY